MRTRQNKVKPICILMLGQEMSLAWEIENLLIKMGQYHIYVECDEKSVKQALSELRPELLLLDMDMPALDYRSLLEDYGSLCNRHGVQAMLLSGIVNWDAEMPVGPEKRYPLLSKKHGAGTLAHRIHAEMAA